MRTRPSFFIGIIYYFFTLFELQNTFPAVIPAKAGIQYNLIMNSYYVYIMASKRNGTLYIGVTNDLLKRIWQHKNNIIEGFTKRYKIHTLVYFEATSDIKVAISKEKQMKKWRRAWKIKLIESSNPIWKDLYNDL